MSIKHWGTIMSKKIYSTLNGLKSKRRFSKVQRTCPYTNKYGIRDYKKKILIPIHKVSIGRWIFKGKKFNKLSDINWRYC
jgi:hypothetical protein